MDILKFTTAGSVDDGKSTLIGRLLYDTNNIKSDILEAITDKQQNNSLNLAHVTDGLRTEREHGITIDVAYKYFSTANRKYIITDAPGHFQFTKNLVTGASGVDLIIILIDVVNGITEQTLQHSQVASFLNIKHVVVAVNKMDLINYDGGRFRAIESQYLTLAEKLNIEQVTFIPISALLGDNVSYRSEKMKWYIGATLQQYLTNCNPTATIEQGPFRFSVQYVLEEYEAYAGKIVSGTLKLKDVITILPGKHLAKVERIIRGFEEVVEANIGQNIVLYVSGDFKPSIGDVFSDLIEIPKCYNSINATVCWLDSEFPMFIGKEYYLRIQSKEVLCSISEVRKIYLEASKYSMATDFICVNEIAKVRIETKDLIVIDTQIPEYSRGILIDPVTNYTSGAFIVD